MERDYITIIGNGPGEIPPQGQGPCIVFNNWTGNLAWTPDRLIKIHNRHHLHVNSNSNKKHLYFLSKNKNGAMCKTETELLNIAEELSIKIGTWPSCGLVALFWALHNHMKLRCFCMPFCPTLIRHRNWSSRYAAPSSYHNYLGERRLALSILKEQGGNIEWPGLIVNKPSLTTTTIHSLDLTSILTQLSEWNNNKQRRILGGKFDRYSTLEFLSRMSLDSIFLSLEQANLKKIESFFFLSRKKPETKNWWLYDYRGSLAADRLLRSIRWCQQENLLYRE